MNRLSSAGAPHRTSMAFYSSQPWPITLDETRLRSRNQGWSSSPNPLTKNPVACQIYIFSNKREFKRKDPIACAPWTLLKSHHWNMSIRDSMEKGKKTRVFLLFVNKDRVRPLWTVTRIMKSKMFHLNYPFVQGVEKRLSSMPWRPPESFTPSRRPVRSAISPSAAATWSGKVYQRPTDGNGAVARKSIEEIHLAIGLLINKS